jgi:F-type H+-transporting ATPase subunit b
MDISLNLIIAQMVNFVVLMLVLTFLFNKFMRPMLRKRVQELKSGFEQVEQQKKEIEKLKLDYNQQLQEMRSNAKQEVEIAIKEGSLRREEILNAAANEAKSAIERARKEIDAEKFKVLKEIHNEVASLTMKATRRLLKKEIDENSSRDLINDMLSELQDGTLTGESAEKR